MKPEGMKDLLVLEQLYQGLYATYHQRQDSITDGGDYAEVEFGLEQRIPRLIDRLKAIESISPLREHITFVLTDLAAMEKRVNKYIPTLLPLAQTKDIDRIPPEMDYVTSA